MPFKDACSPPPQVSAHRDHEADVLLHPPVLEQPKYANKLEKKLLRLTPAHLGLEGARQEVLE
eukprot:scaffold25355_cov80-Isochrysis_galbana.AAC.1